MDCRPISGLTLDQESQRGIKRIRQIRQLSQALAATMAAGVLTTIFAGSKTLEAAYNISATDWETFARAMRGIPDISKNRIRQEARIQIRRHGTDHEQRQFWKGVLNGCSIN